MLLFKQEGYFGERFASVVTRLGADNVKKMLEGDEALPS